MRKIRYLFACSVICSLLCSCAVQSRVPSTDSQVSETQSYSENHWETIQAKLSDVISGADTFFSRDFEKTLTIDIKSHMKPMKLSIVILKVGNCYFPY